MAHWELPVWPTVSCLSGSLLAACEAYCKLPQSMLIAQSYVTYITVPCTSPIHKHSHVASLDWSYGQYCELIEGPT